MIRRILLAACAAIGLGWNRRSPGPRGQPNLRIGLREDPDILDPTLARTLRRPHRLREPLRQALRHQRQAGDRPPARHRLYVEDPRTLLITLREGVRFHDGDAMDAEVALQPEPPPHHAGQACRSEINTIEAIEVVDPLKIRIRLTGPFRSLSQPVDRPRRHGGQPPRRRGRGPEFRQSPGLRRPAERVAQDRIVVERFPDYWNASPSI